METATTRPGPPEASGERGGTRSAILAAAAELLREGGVAAVTTRAVAARAAVQPPALYRLFGDKDGLLDAVAEHELTAYVAGKSIDADEADPVAALQTAWLAHVEFGLENPGLFALLADPSRSVRSEVVAMGLAVFRARVHRIAAAGRLRVAEHAAIQMIRAAGSGAVLVLGALPADERDDDLAEQLWRTVAGAIFTDPPARPAEARRAAVVSLRAHAPELPGLSESERLLLVDWLDRVDAALER